MGDFLRTRYVADDGLPDRVVDTRERWYIGSSQLSGELAVVYLAGGGTIDEFHSSQICSCREMWRRSCLGALYRRRDLAEKTGKGA
jgi:hypothetical protein